MSSLHRRWVGDEGGAVDGLIHRGTLVNHTKTTEAKEFLTDLVAVRAARAGEASMTAWIVNLHATVCCCP